MSKVMTMRAAVERFVVDGMAVAMSCSLEPLVPFAAGHEIIRQGRRDLELIAPISDALFDQMIGAGCARRVTAAWVGNVSEGLGHNYRRAAERSEPGPLEIHDHSNFSIALALWAAAWGSPYIPTRTLLGSDILRSNPLLAVVEGHVRVPALKPDLAILHVQRADAQGRAHAWGPLGIAEEAALAASAVILSCEELVDRRGDTFRSQPGPAGAEQGGGGGPRAGRCAPGAGAGSLAPGPRLHARLRGALADPRRLSRMAAGVGPRGRGPGGLPPAARWPRGPRRAPAPALGAGGLRR